MDPKELPMSTKTASTTSPRSSGGSVPTALERAEDAAENLSDDELRLFGAWLARYASQRLRRPVQFAFRALTDEEKAYGRTLAKELNAPVP
jgi:hypothetical protein